MYHLTNLIEKIRENKVIRARYKDELWYVIYSFDAIRYCDRDGENIGNAIQVTRKNILAIYEYLEDIHKICGYE